ncbi:MAG: peptide deformylase [candidate division WOR-3 bacterium]
MSRIRIYPDLILKEKAKEVKDFSNIHYLIEEMIKVMEEEKGIGLAANQIGVASQVLVGKQDKNEKPIIIINPTIIEASGEDLMAEGCLSIPGVSVEISRAQIVLVRGFNEDGKEIEFRGEGLVARMLQHEIEHLNGILIVDHLPRKEFLKFQMEYGKKKEER